MAAAAPPGSSSSSTLFRRIEQAVQRDEGGRGIADLLIEGELERAARDLLGARSVAILTGFPCHIDHTPPTETDGPSGALAIARALLGLGKRVRLLIDESNAPVLEAAMHASNLASTATTDPSSPPLQLDAFPCSPQWTPADDARLQAVAGEVDAVVAIERAGPGRDGGYCTMRARRMDHLVAPLEKLLALLPPSACTVGIGDGGNELGMGKVEGRVLSSTAIPNAYEICCVVTTRWLVASSVSNWGGYALAAALAVVAAEGEQQAGRQRKEVVQRLLVSSATERAVVEGIVAAGARDGITGERRAWVDGLPLETSLAVLEEIREIACGESS